MASETRNYIAGHWQDGSQTVENRNPSDLPDVIGHYAQASVAQLNEALAVANDSEFGLTAGIMTRSLARASHFRAHMRAGCVLVNLPTAGIDYHVPFGGRGASSFGPREQGQYAAEFHTTVKTAYVAAGTPE